MYLDPGTSIGEVVLVLGVTFIAFVYLIFSMTNYFKGKEIVSNNSDWFDTKCKELELNSNMFLGESDYSDFLAYTKSDYIYIMNKYNHRIIKVDKKDILNIEVELYHLERNVKRLVALTSTYDKSVILSDINLKIITDKEVFNVVCLVNGKNYSSKQYGDSQSILDDANRYKLLIEKDIKVINQ